MREIKVDSNWHFPKTRRTDFTKEEMLDIIDFYLQYKPMLEDDNPQFDPHDFTMILYMYKMADVDYINNVKKIKKNMENNSLMICLKKNLISLKQLHFLHGFIEHLVEILMMRPMIIV